MDSGGLHMFDDYVQHAAREAGKQLLASSTPVSQLQYEGFEPSPYDKSDARADYEEQIGQPASEGASLSPIFELASVQYPFPAPLISFVVSSDVLVMGLINNMIVLVELSQAHQDVKIRIPRKPQDMTIYKLFLDPSGRHLIITSVQGENWYLYRTWRKPKLLKSLKMVIESVAWNKHYLLSSTHSTSTREVLIGGKNGILYEASFDAEEDFFKSHERHLQSVFSLPEKQPITGVKFEYTSPSDPKTALILVTTLTRIYQFFGSIDKKAEDVGRVFNTLFAAYREATPKILELPGDLRHSELQFWTPNSDHATCHPKRMAWLTGPGIYHGFLDLDSQTEDHIDGAALLPYPPIPGNDVIEIPLSLSLTEFHFVLLHKDRIVGVCNLNDKTTYEENLPIKPNETVLGLAADPVRKTYWVYTDQSLFELVVGNEDRDVWKIHLDKCRYDNALRHAKTARQRDQILIAQANDFFNRGHYFQAAQSYAHCSASFEEVALKFLDIGERDSLRAYLVSRLERTRKTDLTQRTMLATWLLQFYMSKCNELDDMIASESASQDVDNLKAERKLIEDDLFHFFETYKGNLNKETVYELIQGHGRTDIYLFYATTIDDYGRVAEHWILEEEWTRAIEVISRQSNLELYYRFGPVLIHRASKETVDSWLRQPSLDPLRLVPSLLQLQHTIRDPSSPNHAIRYLNHVIFDQNSISPIIHNLLITFYVWPPKPSQDDGPLLRFLSTTPTDPATGKPYYDLDYALRICKLASRTQPCVHIYSKMGLWENSVDLALEKGDLELAKVNADMAEGDQQLRRKLWLKIARYVVQDKQDLKLAMQFLENADILKIEDILPFFPDFVVIDDFKEEIAHALEGYSAKIDTLKAEMDDATKTAEAIKQDIAALKNRFLTIDANEQCCRCRTLLLTRQFYVFPCHHTFHADCLISLAKEYLPSVALRRILTLQTQLMKDVTKNRDGISQTSVTSSVPVRQAAIQRTLLSANFGTLVNPLQNSAKAANLLGRSVVLAGDRLRDLIIPDALATLVTSPNWLPGMGGNKIDGMEKTISEKRSEGMKAELEELLTSNCPLCESVVAGLDKDFVVEGADTSWAL